MLVSRVLLDANAKKDIQLGCILAKKLEENANVVKIAKRSPTEF